LELIELEKYDVLGSEADFISLVENDFYEIDFIHKFSGDFYDFA